MIANLENRAFILLLIGVTIGFLMLLQPFLVAIFWAAIIAILFMPWQKRLLARWPERPNLTALLTLGASLLFVVIPITLITVLLTVEVLDLYERFSGGQLSLQPYLDNLLHTFPVLQEWLDRFALNWDAIRGKITQAALSSSQFVARSVFQFGQGYVTFLINAVLMLYLTFFFLRDGPRLIQMLIQSLPLGDAREIRLFEKFAEVCRATVKGSLVVALVQGGIGGIAFWILGIEGAFLWGTLMVILSLLPAVGSALIWAPAAIWLFVSGAWIKGIVLIVVGVLVIGMIDNVLRPILVGRDTKMPDYLVLISTLGGISLFGLSGFVMGPVLAALFLVVWQIFTEEYHQRTRG